MLQIPRLKEIEIEAQDRNGAIFTASFQDINAVCCQHELEHLNGEFFIDKANRQQRRDALRRLK